MTGSWAAFCRRCERLGRPEGGCPSCDKTNRDIEVLVDAAPPLTDEQVTKLRALLPPVGRDL